MDFRVLGQLEVAIGGVARPISGLRQQRILAAMLVHPGRLMPIERLITAIWDDPPVTARRQLQNCISDLRRQLDGPGNNGARRLRNSHKIVTVNRIGYRLNLVGARIDLLEFRRMAGDAERSRAAEDWAAVANTLRAALGLWRGPALAGLAGRVLDATAAGLEELRLTAVERCIEAELRLGRHPRLIAELVELVAAYPLRERLVGHLMVALYRSGRQVDALATYQRLRGRLIDGFGLEPSAALNDLHAAILRDRPAAVLTDIVRQEMTGSEVPPTAWRSGLKG